MGPTFDIVVAADSSWCIGNNGAMPWPKLSKDLKHFRTLTSQPNSAVIYGRKTWESQEISKRPLPGRTNCILTRQHLQVPAGVLVAASLEDALHQCRNASAIFVVGGAEIYRIALQHPGLKHIFLTRIAGDFPCDTRIPNLDQEFAAVEWTGSQHHEENGVSFQMEKLVRIQPGQFTTRALSSTPPLQT